MTNESETLGQRMISSPPDKKPNRDGLPPHQRYLPIEADEALRRRIEADNAVTLDHSLTLNDLLNAYHHEEEKLRFFGLQTADQQVRDVIDELLDVGIEEAQHENGTVVGVIGMMINKVLDIDIRLRKQRLGPILHHSRSSAEVRAEMACVSKTLARLQEELDGALKRERRSSLRLVAKADPSDEGMR